MVYITEDLIRKRAEHNNCEISTLEELSLHQCDIEQIQHIDKWCKGLKILYLQHNLIPKIENLSKLKKLEYLNLALNNILDIENLEGCESLTKLDLTVNFVGRATSVEKLRCNEFLRELFLTGNPCSDYVGYREYVIATLPQLEHLDGSEINRSERIEAMQNLSSLRCDMLRQEKIYFDKLEKEKCNETSKELNEGKPGFNCDWYTDTDGAHIEGMERKPDQRDDKEKKNDDFWNKPCKYTPESRIEMHRHMEEQRKEKENYKSAFPDPKPPKREVRFFNDEGKPFNINQANMDFSLTEDEDEGVYVIDVACYKYLDTSLIDVDIQPLYVRVTIKGSILQLVLMEEISPDRSTAQRSQTTGHLVVTLPKMKHVLQEKTNTTRRKAHIDKNDEIKYDNEDLNGKYYNKQKRETLEIGGSRNKIDIYNIVKDETVSQKSLNEILFSGRVKTLAGSNEIRKEALKNFVDDDDVPPLD